MGVKKKEDSFNRGLKYEKEKGRKKNNAYRCKTTRSSSTRAREYTECVWGPGARILLVTWLGGPFSGTARKSGQEAEETWKEGDTAVKPLPSRWLKAGRCSPAVHIIQSADGYSSPSPVDGGPVGVWCLGLARPDSTGTYQPSAASRQPPALIPSIRIPSQRH